MWTVPPQQKLTRVALSEVRRSARATTDDICDAALTALDGYDPQSGRTDAEQLATTLRRRYGMSIETPPGGGYQTYTHLDFEAALREGQIEMVCVRTYRRIVESTATLFSQQDAAWTFTEPGTDEEGAPAHVPVDPALMAPLLSMRERGRFQVGMVRADRVAVGLGSCGVRPMVRSGRLVYEATPPQCIRVGYGTEIIDGDGDKAERRATDPADLEDATVIAIRLPDGGDERTEDRRPRWIAYMGRSEAYPDGRCVEYSADEWYSIPEPGRAGIIYEHPAGNPLTALQNRVGVDACPFEYPLVAILGTDASSVTPFPLHGLSLYSASQEIDAAWSRILNCSLEAAAKIRVVTRTDAGSTELPKSLSGSVALLPGQSLDVIGPSATDVQASSDILRSLTRTIAEAWSVPGYLVSDDDAASPESGVALAIRSQPMIAHRGSREMLNRDAVERLFTLERCLLWAAHGKEPWPASIEQSWYPGRVQLPRNEKEHLEQLKLGIEIGVIDRVDAVQEYHQFATTEEAQAYAEDIAKRSREVPGMQRGGARRPGGIVPGAAREEATDEA